MNGSSPAEELTLEIDSDALQSRQRYLVNEHGSAVE
jgi:hypothetical protein